MRDKVTVLVFKYSTHFLLNSETEWLQLLTFLKARVPIAIPSACTKIVHITNKSQLDTFLDLFQINNNNTMHLTLQMWHGGMHDVVSYVGVTQMTFREV